MMNYAYMERTVYAPSSMVKLNLKRSLIFHIIINPYFFSIDMFMSTKDKTRQISFQSILGMIECTVSCVYVTGNP